MKNILIFGASGFGKNILCSLDEKSYHVLAFLDNKEDIVGNYFNNIYVDSPDNVSKYNYDYIIISVPEYEQEMKAQLINRGVDEKNILVHMKNMKDILLDEQRLSILRVCLEEIKEKNLNGSLAEVGVYQGEFAKYLNRYMPNNKLYLFDTFEGFSEKDSNNKDEIIDKNVTFKDTSVELVLNKMENKENVIIRKGYFPETTVGIEEEFCFVSLDTDLYQPILNGLEYFYPRLQQGGYIFVHDYGTYQFSGVKEAVREYCNKNNISYVPILDKQLSVIITK